MTVADPRVARLEVAKVSAAGRSACRFPSGVAWRMTAIERSFCVASEPRLLRPRSAGEAGESGGRLPAGCPGSAPWDLCGSGEFLVHLVHALGRVGHVVVEPPGQECEKGAGEEPCSNLDRDGGVAVGLGAPIGTGQQMPWDSENSPG